MRTMSVTTGPLTATNATAIAASQAGTAGTALTLTTSPYVMAHTQQITITSAGNDSNKTFTVVGTTWNGDANTEVITGASIGVATSVTDFATITSIKPSANTAGNVTVGIVQSGGSPWLIQDEWAVPNIGVQCDVTGTATYSVQTTMQDTNSASAPQGNSTTSQYQVNWYDSLTGISSATTSAQTILTFIPRYIRLYQSAGSGTVTMRVVQAGNVMF